MWKCNDQCVNVFVIGFQQVFFSFTAPLTLPETMKQQEHQQPEETTAAAVYSMKGLNLQSWNSVCPPVNHWLFLTSPSNMLKTINEINMKWNDAFIDIFPQQVHIQLLYFQQDLQNHLSLSFLPLFSFPILVLSLSPRLHPHSGCMCHCGFADCCCVSPLQTED